MEIAISWRSLATRFWDGDEIDVTRVIHKHVGLIWTQLCCGDSFIFWPKVFMLVLKNSGPLKAFCFLSGSLMCRAQDWYTECSANHTFQQLSHIPWYIVQGHCSRWVCIILSGHVSQCEREEGCTYPSFEHTVVALSNELFWPGKAGQKKPTKRSQEPRTVLGKNNSFL